ncbi:MAG TPA: hypothetical protein VFN88_02740 [Caulobacteraceae bacterium]|nr:hypothetical protein [Caulobacteraceae bacterium]
MRIARIVMFVVVFVAWIAFLGASAFAIFVLYQIGLAGRGAPGWLSFRVASPVWLSGFVLLQGLVCSTVLVFRRRTAWAAGALAGGLLLAPLAWQLAMWAIVPELDGELTTTLVKPEPPPPPPGN